MAMTMTIAKSTREVFMVVDYYIMNKINGFTTRSFRVNSGTETQRIRATTKNLTTDEH
jgi:hypothetical protein